jgi:O-methyltransferase
MASSREIKLRSSLKKIIIKFFSILGYELKKKNNFNDRWGNFIAELKDDRKKQIKYFQEITLASELNLWSIYQSLKYIKNENVKGDIVECGVYNGNTLAFIGEIVDELKLKKKIWGYDTFDGFIKSHYTDYDIDFKTRKKVNYVPSNIYYSLDEVKNNIIKNNKTNFEKYTLIKGDILETLNIKDNLPNKISFLRLDTDIYKTTLKQLEILYEKLTPGGILHIDDYGICPGVKTAVDNFFSNESIWLHRVDIACRYFIKK